MGIIGNLYENLLDRIDGALRKYDQIIMLGYENFHENIPLKKDTQKKK